MYRKTVKDMRRWAEHPRRKPLIVRGARQVGKTTLIRLFAAEHFDSLFEVNLEREPEVADFFASNDPREICRLLEIHRGQDLVPGRSLLLLDEIQAAPQVLAALRYFYEELPELHVVAAGSLLELALEQPTFSVPVGRIEYLYLGPMHFDEFLIASGQEKLEAYLRDYTLETEMPPAIHRQLLHHLHRFLVIGGMPEAIRASLEGASHRESEAVKHSILTTFRDDFGKYGDRVDHGRLRKVFERLPHLVGRKLKYVHIDRDERSKDLAAALHLLTLARVAYRVRHTAANGVPLGAEASERKFKVLGLDVGLFATASGLSLVDLEQSDDLLSIQRGALCEQFIGQHLLYSAPTYEEPQLYYWMREKRNSSAEVDYVMSHGPRVIPIEVKAGSTGTLKSLHLFLKEKNRRLAVRLSSAPPSLTEAVTALPGGDNVPYRLLSLPLYMVGEVRRLCTDLA